MKTFTVCQLEKLLGMQEALNVKYSGEDWAEKTPMSSLAAANMAELGELLESSARIGDDPTGWKWWKTYVENDHNNIKVEIVDMVHFSLSMLIKAYDKNFGHITSLYENAIRENFEAGPKMESLLGCVSAFTVNCFTLDDYGFVEDFALMIDALARYGEMSTDEMYEIYMKKNELNHKRVEGGYKENKYQKYDENGREDNEGMFCEG